ncbi:MAG: tetratricopeptide repeat protein [Myxococcota bacterium]
MTIPSDDHPSARWNALVEQLVVEGSLATAEQRQLDALSEEEPSRAAEAATLGALASFVDDAPPVDETAIDQIERAFAEREAAAASAPVLAMPARVESRQRTWLVAAVTGLAAAAAVLLWLARPWAPVDRVQPTLAMSEGDVRVQTTASDGSLQPGDAIDVGADGHACLSFAGRISACAPAGTRLTFDSDHPESVALTVHRGQLTARLDPLPAGHRFSIRAAHVRATAVGTIFTVEYDPDGDRIETRVVEGTIDVDVAGSIVRLEAHHGAVISGDRVELEPLTPEDETADLAVLRSRERPTATQVARGAADPPDETARSGAGMATAPRPSTMDTKADEPARGDQTRSTPPRDGEGALRRSPSGPAPRSTSADHGDEPSEDDPGDQPDGQPDDQPDDELIIEDDTNEPATRHPTEPRDAPQMLRRAREALDAGQHRRAATTYRALLDAHPRSPEAQAARVSVAELYLHHLGKPTSAERYFAAYLQRGGPLALQARYGRILALRRSKRPQREAKAIEEFLATHPKSGYAASLRTRLRELGAKLGSGSTP